MSDGRETEKGSPQRSPKVRRLFLVTTGGRVWQVLVVAVAIGYSLLAGIQSRQNLTPAEANIWGALLAYVFVLGYAANRIQIWLTRPPVPPLRAALLGASGCLPMFLGWFPVSEWLMEAARRHNFENTPSPWLILFPMFWGLLAPGGVLYNSLRRLQRVAR